jgi:phosphatidylserine/phosphatidylglycerophosphate/cardiolipin synthase-like enzyme
MKPFIGKIENADIYIGQKAGKRIENYLQNAKNSIKIVSPYIADDMVNLLKNKSNNGVQVAVLTSDDKRHFDNPQRSNVLKNIILQLQFVNERKKELRKWLLFIFGIILLTSIGTITVLSLLGKIQEIMSNHYFIKSIIGIVLFEIIIFSVRRKVRVYTYSYESTFPISFVIDPLNMTYDERNQHKNNAFFHVKLFIIDNETAFIGSVNLTKKGMSYNVESCITITKEEDVHDLSEYFDSIFNQQYYQKNLEYYGRILYNEPIN